LRHNIKFSNSDLPDPVAAPDYIPKYVQTLIEKYAYLKNPWKGEILDIAKQLDTSVSRITRLQLNYELFGGGCTSSAICRNGIYDVLRVLEWPLSNKLLQHTKWKSIGKSSSIKYIPGYTGLLTGKSGKVRIMMNMAADAFMTYNPLGTPITWTLRKLVESNSWETLDEAIADIEKAPKAIIGAWLLVVSEDEAAWIAFNPNKPHEVLKRVSAKKEQNLTIQNSWEYSQEAESIIKNWFNKDIDSLLKRDYISMNEMPEGIRHLGLATDVTVY